MICRLLYVIGSAAFGLTCDRHKAKLLNRRLSPCVFPIHTVFL